MREIKFRAWDKKANKIYQVKNLGVGEEDYHRTANNYGVHPETGMTKFYPSQVIVMQYTGLKDKNGKEAYEKDIILAYILHENGEERYEKLLCESYEGLQDLSWVCEDDSGAYHLGFVHCKSEYKLCSPLVEFEIIGNLYENPELWGGAK